MSKIIQFIASDYAGLKTDNYSINYGYEYGTDDDDNEIWGIDIEKYDKPVFRMAYEDMKKFSDCPGKFEVAECALFGIGLWLSQGDNQ